MEKIYYAKRNQRKSEITILIADNLVCIMRCLCSVMYLFMSQEDIIILSMYIINNWVSKYMLKTKHKEKHLKSIKRKKTYYLRGGTVILIADIST